MTKGPDLSTFPIPRKGGARPLPVDGPQPAQEPAPTVVVAPRADPRRPPDPPPAFSGQIVATTLKLDESRYLRLAEAGKPGPGRLKRRSLQDMLIEALDEWFDRRGL